MTSTRGPVQVKGVGGLGTLAGIRAVEGGNAHSVALKSDGTAWAWGANDVGQLGNGKTTNSSTPVQVKGSGGVGTLSGITAVAAGAAHSLAVKSDGTVWAWGHNFYGQLGNGTTNSSTPVQVKGPGANGLLTGISAVAAGRGHSLAIGADALWGWGDFDYGQTGVATTDPSPHRITGLACASAVSAGRDHSLALSAGSAWGWGRNTDGQAGHHPATDPFGRWNPTPVQVVGVVTPTAIAGGDWHSLALESGGTVKAWGRNTSGQLGTNSPGGYSPVVVNLPLTMAQPSGNGSTVC